MNSLKIKLHYPEMTLPSRSHESDIGLDLTAMAIIEKPNNIFMFDTGVSVQPPPDYYTEVVPRSSISKTNFILANSVGIIDPHYRGKIFCAFRYVGTGNGTQEAHKLVGTRIAQLITRYHKHVPIEEVVELNDTERGSGGFGSTGK